MEHAAATSGERLLIEWSSNAGTTYTTLTAGTTSTTFLFGYDVREAPATVMGTSYMFGKANYTDLGIFNAGLSLPNSSFFSGNSSELNNDAGYIKSYGTLTGMSLVVSGNGSIAGNLSIGGSGFCNNYTVNQIQSNGSLGAIQVYDSIYLNSTSTSIPRDYLVHQPQMPLLTMSTVALNGATGSFNCPANTSFQLYNTDFSVATAVRLSVTSGGAVVLPQSGVWSVNFVSPRFYSNQSSHSNWAVTVNGMPGSIDGRVSLGAPNGIAIVGQYVQTVYMPAATSLTFGFYTNYGGTAYPEGSVSICLLVPM